MPHRRPAVSPNAAAGAAAAGRAAGFTLVELLVVIGIIAVLISVLLPSLNKARQAANLIDCQARLRQMGQALQMYTGNGKGLLPWGYVDRTSTASWTTPGTRVDATPANKEPYWFWYFTLSEILNRNLLDNNSSSPTYGQATNLSPIFRDKDTVDVNDNYFVCHYTCNPRLFYLSNFQDNYPSIASGGAAPPIQAKDRLQRKMTQVKRPSDVFVIWDAPQCGDDFCRNNAYPTANAIDHFALDQVTGLCYDSPTANVKYDVASLPGILGLAAGLQDGRAFQKQYNTDQSQYTDWRLSHLRFRHMNNTMLAALCLDGHVEQRRVGSVLRTDLYSNRPN